MQGETRQRWWRLCEEAVIEQDTEKLVEIAKEIDRLLKQKQERLKKVSPGRSFLFSLVPSRRKLDFEIYAAPVLVCPYCTVKLELEELHRVDAEHLKCPWCGETFPTSYKIANVDTERSAA